MGALLVLISAGVAGSQSLAVVKPDLVPLLPSTPTKTQTTPIYIDTFVKPGHVLYRFDSVIFNRGGILDIYHDGTTGKAIQVLWPDGVPSEAPRPDAAPSASIPGLVLEDRSPFGAAFQYEEGGDHNHFHLLAASKYEFVVPGLGALPAAKIGFCLVDTFGTPPNRYFPYPEQIPVRWCGAFNPAAQFFREGISPQGGDLYNSQIDDQWIDVTGVRPGKYGLRATVNPLGYIDESDTSNNTIVQDRTVPGALASSVKVGMPRRATTIRLRGSVVAPSIPARVSASCFPLSTATNCVRRADPTRLSFALATSPCLGRVALKGGPGGRGQAIYTPPRTRLRPDGFSYTTTDSRGLRSQPAFVRIGSSAPVGTPWACLIGAQIAADRRATLQFVTTGKQPPGTRWAVYVNARPSPAVVTNGRATTIPLDSGRNLVWLELVKGTDTLVPRVQSRELTIVVP